MKTLFTLDRADYSKDLPIVERYCVRALIERKGELAVQRSAFGEYKLPGGGVEEGEDARDTLIREVLEETGLHVRPEAIREIGEVIEKRRDVFDSKCIYLNHTYFFSCEVSGEQEELHLTPEEQAKGYTAVFRTINEIVEENDKIQKDYWRRRDTLFLKWYTENR